jgi:hypothetical protein
LHGKSDPEASSGELFRVDLPYGTGVAIIMCALLTDARPRTAAMMDVENIMLIIV